ncbi:Retrovirus-related Pol polyprotein from transposon 17.6, partial [Mucuna pruriens]
MQIHIAPEDQHKTTFTSPFDTFAYTRMPFGLCYAPSTSQRCMLNIFSDLLEECMEVLMDEFTVYADTFEACLGNLSRVLKRCIRNCIRPFGINRRIEFYKAKIDVISSLPKPASVRDVCSFLGHISFYRRIIRNFSKITLPLSKLLQKYVDFVFDEININTNFVGTKLAAAIQVNPTISHDLLTYAISLSLPHSCQVHPSITKKRFKVMQSITYGTTPIYGDVVMTVLFTGVFRILRFGQSSTFSILHLEVATMDPPERPEKYLNVDFTSLLFFETRTNLSQPTSNWVEARATRTNDAKAVVDFLKSNIFCRFSVPKALISDQGTRFYNRVMSSLLEKYGVPFHISPQTNDQAEVFNREIKKILLTMVNPSRKDWSRLLDDVLWAHTTTY